MSDARGSLVHLVNTLAADGELDAADLARIEAAIGAERRRIDEERHWRERARVVDEPHEPVVTILPDGSEDVDVSRVVCDDCGRGLIADAGSEPVLVCPRLHGRRPRDLRPTHPTGAVCCGG